jgi:hypothetical protein
VPLADKAATAAHAKKLRDRSLSFGFSVVWYMELSLKKLFAALVTFQAGTNCLDRLTPRRSFSAKTDNSSSIVAPPGGVMYG